MIRLPVLACAMLALAGCGKSATGPKDIATLDRELTDGNSAGPARDPALSAALHDQIMVDPALAQSANRYTVRPATRPDPGAVPPDAVGASRDTVNPAQLRHTPAAAANCPDCKAAKGALTLGALAERQPRRSVAECAPGVHYSSDWANRLPAALPLYPDARVSEAAGNNANGCTLRIVSFTSQASLTRVSDWYYTHATQAGYSAEHSADGTRHVLGGAQGQAAYIIYLTPRGNGGTDVDLVTNAGR